jgi:hypothetical protein
VVATARALVKIPDVNDPDCVSRLIGQTAKVESSRGFGTWKVLFPDWDVRFNHLVYLSFDLPDFLVA